MSTAPNMSNAYQGFMNFFAPKPQQAPSPWGQQPPSQGIPPWLKPPQQGPSLPPWAQQQAPPWAQQPPSQGIPPWLKPPQQGPSLPPWAQQQAPPWAQQPPPWAQQQAPPWAQQPPPWAQQPPPWAQQPPPSAQQPPPSAQQPINGGSDGGGGTSSPKTLFLNEAARSTVLGSRFNAVREDLITNDLNNDGKLTKVELEDSITDDDYLDAIFESSDLNNDDKLDVRELMLHSTRNEYIRTVLKKDPKNFVIDYAEDARDLTNEVLLDNDKLVEKLDKYLTNNPIKLIADGSTGDFTVSATDTRGNYGRNAAINEYEGAESGTKFHVGSLTSGTGDTATDNLAYMRDLLGYSEEQLKEMDTSTPGSTGAGTVSKAEYQAAAERYAKNDAEDLGKTLTATQINNIRIRAGKDFDVFDRDVSGSLTLTEFAAINLAMDNNKDGTLSLGERKEFDEKLIDFHADSDDDQIRDDLDAALTYNFKESAADASLAINNLQKAVDLFKADNLKTPTTP